MNSPVFLSSLVYGQLRQYIVELITQFGYAGLGRMFVLALQIGTVGLTLWFMVQGLRIATGQSKTPFLGFVLRAIVVLVVVATAQGFALLGMDIASLIPWLQNVIAQAITGGDYQDPASMVQTVVGYMLALQTALQVHQSSVTAGISMANVLAFLTGVSQALPAMLAGGLLLLNEVALNLCLVLAPLFTLCYLSSKTRFLFVNWVKFTVANLLSMVVLSVVTTVALQALLMLMVGLFSMDTAGNLVGDSGLQLTDMATLSGGVGLLLTVLVLGVPPVVANFFNGGAAVVFSGMNPIGQMAYQVHGAKAGSSPPPVHPQENWGRAAEVSMTPTVVSEHWLMPLTKQPRAEMQPMRSGWLGLANAGQSAPKNLGVTKPYDAG